MKPFQCRGIDHTSVAVLVVVFAVSAGCQTQIDPASVPKFVVQVEEPVTNILSPITDEGYVDYLEAANQRHSQGVTADNNWDVVVRKAFGPLEDLDAPSQRDYYQRLGIPQPTEPAVEGEYFRSPRLRLSGEGVSELEQKLGNAFYDIETPWRTEDFPELAAWLEQQSKHLDDFVTGSRLPRYYAPYAMSAAAHTAKVREIHEWFGGLEKSSGKMTRLAGRAFSKMFAGFDEHPAPLSRFHAASMQQSRELFRALRIRALWRIGEGDIARARSDINAIHRIGRLLDQGMLDEWLVGGVLEESACSVEVDLLQSGKLTSESARQQLQELNRLPSRRSADDLTDTDDRHVALDALQYAACRRDELVRLFNAEQSEIDRRTVRAYLAIDWNAAMRTLNEKFDKYVAALQQSHGPARLDVMREFGPRTRATKAEVLLEEVKEAAKAGPEALTQFMGQLYFDRYAHILPKIELRPQARRDVARAAYAAYLFQLQEGTYPKSLDELTAILGTSLVDPYTGTPLILKSIEDGIVIYSVGENLIDDGGRTYDDGKDDILARLTGARVEPARE